LEICKGGNDVRNCNVIPNAIEAMMTINSGTLKNVWINGSVTSIDLLF